MTFLEALSVIRLHPTKCMRRKRHPALPALHSVCGEIRTLHLQAPDECLLEPERYPGDEWDVVEIATLRLKGESDAGEVQFSGGTGRMETLYAEIEGDDG